METAEAKYAGVLGVGDDKDQKVDQGNSGSSKILFLHQYGAGVGAKVVRSHAEFDFRKSEKAIGEIAYENRVGNSIAFPDSSDDISTSLRSMPRGDKGTQDLGGNLET